MVSNWYSLWRSGSVRHLVLWSGGPDSTLSLKDVLTQTNDPVVALHVSLKFYTEPGRMPKWQYELGLVKTLYPMMQKMFRPFELITNEFKIDHCVISDILIMVPFAAGACNYYKDIGKIWTGDDSVQDDGMMDNALKSAIQLCIFGHRHPKTNLNIDYHPKPGTNRSKQKIREDLGEELWNTAISCRQPYIDGSVCGECESCKERLTTHA